MRPRDDILGNLESIYQASFDAAKRSEQPRRMEELDNAYQRDQLMMEILLDVRDLLARQPAAPPGASVLDQLEALRRLAKR
jgi:hypothetical protein